MVAGDTVKIHAGTYTEEVIPINSGEAGSHITYEAAGDGEVIIKPPADSAYKTCIFLQSWARLEYLKFINLTLDNSQHVSVGQTITADTAAISGGETNDINTPQYLDKPHTNIIIDNCKIINSFVGIYFYYKAKDIQITNCVLDGNQYGIMLIDYVQNVLIENNIIRNSKQYHPTDSDGDNMRIIAFNQRYNSDIIIRNNEVSDSLRQGILFTGTDNGLIEDNHTFNNGATGIQIEGADDGRMLKNVVIRNNISEHNAQRYGAETGIWVDDATNVVVENNIMRYNATGFRITGSDQVIARNNLIYENHYYGGSNKCTGTQNIGWTSAGIWTWGNATTPDGGKDHIIVHNTIYKNGNQNPCNNRPFSQISLNYNSISAANPGGYPQLSGTVFKNNISSMSNATNPATDLVVEANGVTGFSVDYNNYYSPARAAGLNVNLINANHPGNSSGGATYGWEEYKSDTGFDAHSMITDPLFINQNSYDFNLNANSLAINNGDFLTKANNAGNNSTSLIVQDARYFTDGYGLVEGDKIKIGSNNPASITNVDYGSNIITLAENLSWNNGDNVSYVYSGAKPDIGALESDYITPACTSFTYSSWSLCANGTQSRTVKTSSPANCTGGTPLISRTCTKSKITDKTRMQDNNKLH